MPRSIDNQPIPQDISKVVIGIMQCRVSSLTTLSSAVTQTGVTSTTSTLGSADSIGSLGEATIGTNVVEKPFKAGYPMDTYSIIIEDAEVTINVTMHEFYNTNTTPLIDALMAAINDKTMYACSLELVAEFQFGGVKSIWFPNAILIPNFDFNPGTDFATFPISFRAIKQTGAAIAAPVIKVN